MVHAASEGLLIDPMTSHCGLIIGLLPIHLRVYAVAGGVRDDFKCFIQTSLFGLRNICANRYALALLDDNLKKVLLYWGQALNGLGRFQEAVSRLELAESHAKEQTLEDLHPAISME